MEGSTTVDGECVSSVGDMGEWPADRDAPASGALSWASGLTAVVSIVMVGLQSPTREHVGGQWIDRSEALFRATRLLTLWAYQEPCWEEDYGRMPRTSILIVNKVRNGMVLREGRGFGCIR